MLPDVPKVKEQVQEIFDRLLQQAIYNRMGVFAGLDRHTVHEGEEMRVHRADGTSEDTPMKAASAEMTVKYEEAPFMSIADRIAKINEIAESMARQMAEHMFTSLNVSLEKAGQVVDGRGQPFGPDLLLATLEKMHIDFDEHGNAKDLQFVVGPSLMPKIREMIEKDDPEVKRRHDEIMTKKWQDWRDRENSRKLVG